MSKKRRKTCGLCRNRGHDLPLVPYKGKAWAHEFCLAEKRRKEMDAAVVSVGAEMTPEKIAAKRAETANLRLQGRVIEAINAARWKKARRK